MEIASTQYTDVKGTAAADFHGLDVDIHALAEAAEIDTERYFPVGMRIYGVDLRPYEFYVVDMYGWPEKKFEAVQEHLRTNSGAIETIVVDWELQFDMPKFLKRLDIVFSSRGFHHLV
jgi:hypothetical protein